jgi:acetyltransferase-like isoleucine patch superfamily enzyme
MDMYINRGYILMRKGDDVYLADSCEIKRPHLCSLGSHVAIDSGFYCTIQLTLGDYIHVGPYVTCIGGKNGEFIAKGFNNIMAGARIVCGSDRFDGSGLFGAMIPDELKGRQIIKPVIMEEFSNIGTNAVVLPGSILRKGVLLTVGSVLFGDTEEWGVYKGNPAKLVKKINAEKVLLNAAKMGYPSKKA